jgi:L-threonylcarbamoyladenylate synthase
MTARLPDGPGARDEAIRVLRGGGIVAVPTDTVYGIAVALGTPGGIERLFAAKRRPPDKAIAVLLADAAQAAAIGDINPAAAALADACWPGGLTLVVPRRGDMPLPAALTGGALAPGAIPTVGLRVPDHEAPRALARVLGPLPTTSANRSGEPELGDADAIEAALGDALDLILDGGPARGGPASTVVDCSGPAPVIRRAGAVPVEVVEAILGVRGGPAATDD